MWLIAAVQSSDPLSSVAASTALTVFLVSVVVGKDRRSRPTDHGKQTIAAAEMLHDFPAAFHGAGISESFGPSAASEAEDSAENISDCGWPAGTIRDRCASGWPGTLN